MTAQNIPEILKAANIERNRRLWFWTYAFIALLLIGAIIYFGVATQLHTGNLIKEKGHCYLCGLQEGKKCEQMYFTEFDLKFKSIDEWLLEIAEHNAKSYPQIRDINDPIVR